MKHRICSHSNTVELHIPRANHWWLWCKNCGALTGVGTNQHGTTMLEGWILPKRKDKSIK